MPNETAPTSTQPDDNAASGAGHRSGALLDDERALARKLARYRNPCPRRATLELGLSAVPFFAFAGAALAGVHFLSWWFVLLALPAAGFLVRLFMIQHDCGHGSFFGRQATNDLIGRAIGVLTLTPYNYWRRLHAMHHATAGDLARRGTGDITTMTVAEYRSLPPARRIGYRLIRNPLVMLTLGPVYLFVLRHRLPIGLMRSVRDGWASVMATNTAIAAIAAAGIFAAGLWPFTAVAAITSFTAGLIGVWLFYVQHQFESTSWTSGDAWDFHSQALAGASFYDLPAPLRWLTANIGVHHVHHLVSRIPSYRLGECLRDFPELRQINRLTLVGSLKSLRLALWDEERRSLVRFRDAKQRN